MGFILSLFYMSHSFWYNEPTILFHRNHIAEIYPTNQMSHEAKLNAISRLVILMCIIGYAFTHNEKLFIIGTITLALILSMYQWKKREGFEKFTELAREKDKEKAKKKVAFSHLLETQFHPTTKQNPFGNVLLTDIGDNPERHAAAPSFHPIVQSDIKKAVKKQTQMLHPDIDGTNKQIYGDLLENYNLDKSLARFYSTPNTRVENDQGAFANYLYGGMHSSKEETPEGAMMRVKNNGRHIDP